MLHSPPRFALDHIFLFLFIVVIIIITQSESSRFSSFQINFSDSFVSLIYLPFFFSFHGFPIDLNPLVFFFPSVFFIDNPSKFIYLKAAMSYCLTYILVSHLFSRHFLSSEEDKEQESKHAYLKFLLSLSHFRLFPLLSSPIPFSTHLPISTLPHPFHLFFVSTNNIFQTYFNPPHTHVSKTPKM